MSSSNIAQNPNYVQVYEAINQVTSSISRYGVSKDHYNSTQRFHFRCIDDVYSALSPCLAEAGLIILQEPEIINNERIQNKSGGSMNRIVLKVKYTFVSKKDGSQCASTFHGEAMDTGDKAFNKAIAAAYKYMAFQTFCIPLEGVSDDADASSPEMGDVVETQDAVFTQMVENLSKCDTMDKLKKMYEGYIEQAKASGNKAAIKNLFTEKERIKARIDFEGTKQ